MELLKFLEQRRDGNQHSTTDLASFVHDLVADKIPDYQASAWLMAAFLNPLSESETVALTRAMADSGTKLPLEGLPKPWVDKHSTGGVGDKTTLILVPLLGAAGLTVVKMSGRGLGITGGTVDKLESIPGFRTDLSQSELIEQAGRIGVALTGQTADLAPADKILYSLRDVTATVDSIPLIVASILSKKLASGAEKLVLDVKCGEGAFMKDKTRARKLAEMLVRVAGRLDLPAVAALTEMDQPLGSAVGNALEVREALRFLDHPQPGRLRDLIVGLAGRTLFHAGAAQTPSAGEAIALERLTTRAARKVADDWIQAQAGISFEVALRQLVIAPHQATLLANRTGFIKRVSAHAIGESVRDLGGGRSRKNDPIDHRVGIEVHIQIGGPVQAGQPLLTVFAASEEEAQAHATKLQHAVEIVDDPISAPPIIYETIGL